MSKYFKYAIGEIILVVIGILIALQINTWNENRLERTKSREFHQRIIEDLDLTINTLEAEIKRSEQVKSYIVSAINIIKSGSLTKDNKDTLDGALKNYFQFVRIDENLKSIEELKSSGQFGLIYNKELRKSIDDYSRFLSVVSRIFDQLSRDVNDDAVIEKHIFIKIAENNRNNTVTYNFAALQKDPIFINKLSKISLNWNTKKSFSTNLLDLSIKLKKKVQKELDN